MTRTGSGRFVRAALVALVTLLAPLVAAAGPSLVADVSVDLMGVGDQAVYTLTVSDAMGGDLEMPRFGNLRVSGPSKSMQSSFSFGGGRQRVQTSSVYAWTVSAGEEGRYVIGPATLRHNGEVFTSNTVEFRVEGQAAPRPQRQPPRARGVPGANGLLGNLLSQLGQLDGMDPLDGIDPFDAFAAFDDQVNGRTPRQASTGEADVFMRATIDKQEAYLGEQVTLSLYLFSQVDVTGVQSITFPKLDGFWAEDLETPTTLTPEIKTIKGVSYRAYMVRRRALFPLRAGELVIDPVEAQVGLGLGGIFGGGQEAVKRRSVPVKLKVKPLPADGQPEGFEASNVGDFSLSATATPQRVALGQPVQLRLTIDGSGSLKGLSLPKLPLPQGLKSFDPTVTDKVRVAQHRYGGTKSVEWVIIPERTGAFTLPAIELPIFAPSKGAYQVLRSSPIDLEVIAPAGGAPSASAQPGVASPGAVNVLSGGIRPVRLDAALEGDTGTPPWNAPHFWPLAGGPVALGGLAWGLSALVAMRRRRDPGQLKVRRARGVADKRLQAAQNLAQSGESQPFFAEVVRALQQFVSDKWGIAALGLTREELATRLVESGLSSADAEALRRLLDTCETARFSPLPADAEALAGTLDEASRLIDAIDALKSRRAS